MILNDGWLNKTSIDVPVVQRLTFKVSSIINPLFFVPSDTNPGLFQYALFIIGKCAFGFPFKWSEPPTGPNGGLSLQEALRITTDTFLIMITAPKWAFKLPIQK